MAINHLLGIFQAIRRGSNDFDPFFTEFIKMFLKISQLPMAEWSPDSSVDQQYRPGPVRLLG
ncbi:MAG: hypothetical protein QG555_1031 [Thermodesulfobacteriota bacterium]|nr:hypothetical protein [Thermodesulfobacteriota bacterium]